MNVSHTALMFILSILLVGCFGAKEDEPPAPAPAAAPPPPKPPTKVELRVEAAGDTNPNVEGHGAPVMLRIYELKGLAGFNGADFFALYDKDQASLGPEFARKRELLLRPGEKQTLVLEPEEGTGFVAALAAFRKLESARWRVSAPIPPHQTSVFELKLSGTQLTLTAQPAPAAAAKPAAPDAKAAPATANLPKVPATPSTPTVPSTPAMPSVPTVPTTPTAPAAP